MKKNSLKKRFDEISDLIDSKVKEFVENPFKVGDIVCLKSGGKPMTVASLGNQKLVKTIEDLSPILCWYSTESGPKKEWIDVIVLRKY